MTQLFQEVLQWWLVLFVIGIVFFPVVSRFFTIFFDKGYAFSKTVGLVSIGVGALFLSTTHILPFTTVSLYIVTAVLGTACVWFGRKSFLSLKTHWKILVYEEVLFFAGLFFWSLVKSYQPDIHGLEKFMDYGFINSILRTTYFPPKDMWMTPLFINYYYFGHMLTAILTKLSLLPSTITFNLMLATIFASTFLGSFSLGASFIFLLFEHWGDATGDPARVPAADANERSHRSGVRSGRTPISGPRILIAGLLTAFLVTFAGNLHTMYTLFTPYQNDNPVPPTQLVFSPQTFPNQYWYPNATRFIYHTIHEFPIYSFVVSDLHGHVLDIPNVLLMIAVLLVIFLQSMRNLKLEMRNSIILGSLSGVMYMTNAWDGLIYLGVSSLLVIFKTFTSKEKSLLHTTYYILLLLGSFIVISLPFSLFFKPFASQIGINCAPQFLLNIGHVGPILFEPGYCQFSPLWQLAVLWGFFFFWFVSLLALLFTQAKKDRHIYTIDLFVLCLGLLGFALIVVPEFVYLKDIYTTYFRANTMFKLVYQSFILLSLVSGYTAFRVYTSIRLSHKSLLVKILTTCYILLTTALIALVAIYPYFAITSYFNNFKNFEGLDGTTYLKGISQGDYAAINWINIHIKNQPVMLEAQGDSYTDYERISSNTGLPTVFGWMVHEWLWRGTYNIAPPRIADVKALYESTSLAQTKNLLQKYNVVYVYVGDMERDKYPLLDEEKFSELGKIVYQNESVKIYKI